MKNVSTRPLLFGASRKKYDFPFDKSLQRDDSFIHRGEGPSDIYMSLVDLLEDGSTLFIAAGTPLGEQIIKASGLTLSFSPKKTIS